MDNMPLSLEKAARVLREEAPEYAFSARVLREMCDGRVIPCLLLPARGLVHKCRYYVRPVELVEFFKGKENRYVK